MNPFHSYKAIISDFDGTLVGPDFQISPVLKDAVNKWQNSGRLFTIATGKVYKGIIERNCEYLGIKVPVIVCSGAQIIDPISKDVVFAEYVGKEEVVKLIELLNKTKILYEIQTDNAVYASSKELAEIQKHKTYENIKDFTAQDAILVRLVTTNLNQDEVNNFVRMSITERFKNLHVIQSNTPYSTGINITAKDATKHTAVLRLAKFIDVLPSDMIGIGDGLNDYPLLTACGYKVALESSPNILKEITDKLIPGHEKNGVAEFIYNII